MANIRLEWAQFGDFDSFEVIRSNTSLEYVADSDLPAPIATNLKTMFYVDNTVIDGSVYYYKVRALRDSEAFVSGQVLAAATPLPELTGGNEQVITILDQDYKVHTFTANGTVNVTKAGMVDILVVGGGGGAGVNAVGGAGGGGVILQSLKVNEGVYSVIVGAGGYSTANGGDSSIFDVVALGGGHTRANSSGAVGGCGGGGSASTRIDPAGGAGTPGQGFDGGRAFGNTDIGSRRGGGGGGAGAPGTNAAYAVAGNGGDGLLVTIRGVEEYFGGGGGAHNGGIGGKGGGGSGNVNGAPNTGGGCGGYGNGPGSGGSGIVIIRYLI